MAARLIAVRARRGRGLAPRRGAYRARAASSSRTRCSAARCVLGRGGAADEPARDFGGEGGDVAGQFLAGLLALELGGFLAPAPGLRGLGLGLVEEGLGLFPRPILAFLDQALGLGVRVRHERLRSGQPTPRPGPS